MITICELVADEDAAGVFIGMAWGARGEVSGEVGYLCVVKREGTDPESQWVK